MKKVFLVALAIVLITGLLFFTGCTKQEPEPAPSPTPTPTLTQAPTPTPAPTPPSTTTISGELKEGRTETYTINDKSYSIEVLSVSSEGLVRFKINGEITNELSEGETDVLAEGSLIGVHEVLPKEAEEVSFLLGTNKIELSEVSGVKIDGKTIEDAEVIIEGYPKGESFEIKRIKYRLLAGSDIYIPPGTGLREQLDEPEGMLTPFWDIRYEGLMDTGVTQIRIDAAGDDEYNLEFTNQEGIFYDIPLMSNKNPEVGLVFGDDDDDLWFTESNNFVIDDGDYFIVSRCLVDNLNVFPPADLNNNTCFTHVLRYDGIDPASRQLTFTDLGTGTREAVMYDEATFQGDLVVGGATYVVKVNDRGTGNSFSLTDAAYNLTVDLNGDGSIIDGDKILIAVQGGGLIAFDAFQCLDSSGVRAIPVAGGVEDGASTTSSPHQDTATIKIVTLSKEFSEAGGDEVIEITFEARANNRIGISSVTSGTPATTFFGLLDLQENEDIWQGLSGYGVFVERYNPPGTAEAEDLTIEYPLSQRGARVFVTGELAAQAIPLTAVKPASEIPDITQFNAIVIGSPCVNPIAAQLLGNPDPCWESVPENKSVVKLFEHANGNVALLISGRTPLHTRQGCRAIATGANASVDWPAPFVVDGIPAANLVIIVGDSADGSDVVGAMDVIQSLQQMTVVEKEAEAAVSGIVVTGDAIEIGSPSDLLELGETLGEVKEVLTEVDLDMLKGGHIVTDEGSSEYNQYLKFGDSGRIIFAEDERDKVGHYLYFEKGTVVFEWELEFEEGLESEISGSGSTRDLEDLEDEDITVLGEPFIIADTDLSDDNQLTIELMGGATGGILGENDKEIYVCDGKEYEVEVIAISETAASGEGAVKFRINGEITDELEDGETDVLADGTQIGIRDILATGKDIQKSIIQFYIVVASQ